MNLQRSSDDINPKIHLITKKRPCFVHIISGGWSTRLLPITDKSSGILDLPNTLDISEAWTHERFPHRWKARLGQRFASFWPMNSLRPSYLQSTLLSDALEGPSVSLQNEQIYTVARQ